MFNLINEIRPRLYGVYDKLQTSILNCTENKKDFQEEVCVLSASMKLTTFKHSLLQEVSLHFINSESELFLHETNNSSQKLEIYQFLTD